MCVLFIAYTLVLRQMFAHVFFMYLELVQNRLHAEFKSSLLQYDSTKTFTLPHLILISLLLVIIRLVLILPCPLTPSYRPLVGRHKCLFRYCNTGTNSLVCIFFVSAQLLSTCLFCHQSSCIISLLNLREFHSKVIPMRTTNEWLDARLVDS